MTVELEVEEEVIHQERDQRIRERRDRNALAIAEVVGRNPILKPATMEGEPTAPTEQG